MEVQQLPFNNAISEKKQAPIIAEEVGKETEIKVIVVETEIIVEVEIIEVETVAIKTKEEMIGNAPNAETATSGGEIRAIDARQNGQLMLEVAVTEVETAEEIAVDTKGIAEAETVEETEVGTVVDTKEIAEAETVEETEVETVVQIEVENVEETEVETVVQIEAVPQNPVIGEIVPQAETEIADLSVVAIDQRRAQIILSRTEITNHTVLPHSVQYNSFLRSSRFILNE